jgi:hypothetical protein
MTKGGASGAALFRFKCYDSQGGGLDRPISRRRARKFTNNFSKSENGFAPHCRRKRRQTVVQMLRRGI